jgi:hypothetical protein
MTEQTREKEGKKRYNRMSKKLMNGKKNTRTTAREGNYRIYLPVLFMLSALILGLFVLPPVSAADLVISGKVTESVTDTTTLPLAGMRVVLSLNTVQGIGSGVGIIDDTITDSNGEFQLMLPSSYSTSEAEPRIEIDIRNSGYRVKSIQSTGGTGGGTGSSTAATITYKPPLFGKDFTNNLFILETTSQSLPPGTVLLSLGSIQGSSGTARVPIMVKGADAIGNMDITVDSSGCSGLKYTDAVPGSLTQNSLTSAKDTGSFINIGIVDSRGISGEGSLMYLSYTISSADAASCSIKIKSIAGNKLDGTEIRIITSDGKFSSGALQGDANKDGMLTTVDALMAVQMSTGEIPPDLVADMNSDGRVTSFDALSILKSADTSRIASGVLSGKIVSGRDTASGSGQTTDGRLKGSIRST